MVKKPWWQVAASDTNGKKALSALPPEDGQNFVLQSDFTASDLTPQQIQEFEEESSALMKSLSDDLSAIQQTERKLGEISDMQSQLIQHLGSQAEVSDHLNQEAIANRLEVGRGNEQLQKAKDNHRQASKYLCMFLIGSGLGLLFLHCEWIDVAIVYHQKFLTHSFLFGRDGLIVSSASHKQLDRPLPGLVLRRDHSCAASLASTSL
jgi:hypothetical protein